MAIEHEERQSRRTFAIVGAALVAALVLAGIVVAVVVRGGGDDGPGGEASAEVAGFRDLVERVSTAGGPVFWVGPRPGMQYEYSRTPDGRIYIRYLPPDVEAGDPRAEFLTVGTYPVDNAVAAARERAEEEGAVARDLTGGALAVYNEDTPRNVYVAFPRSNRLIEIFHPSPETARELAYSGAVRPVGAEAGSTPEERGEPVEADIDKLEEVAREADNPVYWLGPRDGVKYELTRHPNGDVYIRYLPEDVEIGHFEPAYEIVGTYPNANALQDVEEQARRLGAVTFDVPGGGRGYYDRSTPTNVHFAVPGVDARIEVFHPREGRAEELVRSGRVVPIR